MKQKIINRLQRCPVTGRILHHDGENVAVRQAQNANTRTMTHRLTPQACIPRLATQQSTAA